jgi:hypothetical protein
VLPPALLAFPGAAVSWGAGAAFRQLVYDAALGTFLVEVLFVAFRKMPFVAEYVPGRANLKLTILPWAGAFLAYAYGLSRLEANLLGRPYAFAVFIGGIALLTAALASMRNVFVRKAGLSFEDPPETPSLGLDE